MTAYEILISARSRPTTQLHGGHLGVGQSSSHSRLIRAVVIGALEYHTVESKAKKKVGAVGAPHRDSSRQSEQKGGRGMEEGGERCVEQREQDVTHTHKDERQHAQAKAGSFPTHKQSNVRSRAAS